MESTAKDLKRKCDDSENTKNKKAPIQKYLTGIGRWDTDLIEERKADEKKMMVYEKYLDEIENDSDYEPPKKRMSIYGDSTTCGPNKVEPVFSSSESDDDVFKNSGQFELDEDVDDESESVSDETVVKDVNHRDIDVQVEMLEDEESEFNEYAGDDEDVEESDDDGDDDDQ